MNIKVKRFAIFFFICLLISLPACLPGGRMVISAEDATSTALKVTLQSFATKVAFQPTKTPLLSFTPDVTFTPNPSAQTPLPLLTNTLQPSPTVAVEPGCYVAQHVSETISDEAVMTPGRFFTKTWTIKNIGKCVWTKEFRFVFESGEQMTERSTVEFITDSIKPGQTITIILKMLAPEDFGEHIGYWKIQTPEGYRFGTGEENKALWLRIMIAPEDQSDFTLTKVELYALPNSYTGPCGKEGYPITLYAKVSSNKAGTIQYTFVGTKGVEPKKSFSMTFFGADTQEIFYVFRIFKGSVLGYARFYAGEPVNQSYEKAKFNVTCTQ